MSYQYWQAMIISRMISVAAFAFAAIAVPHVAIGCGSHWCDHSPLCQDLISASNTEIAHFIATLAVIAATTGAALNKTRRSRTIFILAIGALCIIYGLASV